MTDLTHLLIGMDQLRPLPKKLHELPGELHNVPQQLHELPEKLRYVNLIQLIALDSFMDAKVNKKHDYFSNISNILMKYV